MIGSLKGEVLHKDLTTLILDVRGIGFQVVVGESLTSVVTVGQDLLLHTHLLVKQDGLDLYGFESLLVRDLFRKLMQVSGVGGKNALSLVDHLGASEIVFSIQGGDAKVLAQAPGIGMRVASRIINDLDGKLDDLQIGDGLPEANDVKIKQNAIQALTSLGYDGRTAGAAVNGSWIEGMDLEELVRRSLQRLNI